MKTIDLTDKAFQADFAKLSRDEQQAFLALEGKEFQFARGAEQPEGQSIPTETRPSHEVGMDTVSPRRPLDEPEPVRAFLRDLAIKSFRPIAEGAGATGGAVLGSIYGGPVGGAVMGGAGYAGGKALADRWDEALGRDTGRSKPFGTIPALPGEKTDTPISLESILDPVGEFMRRGSDAEVITRPIRDAAGMAGAGAAGEAALSAGIKGAGKLKDLIINGKMAQVSKALGSTAQAEKAVGEYLAATTQWGPLYAKNIEEAKQIEAIINKGANAGEPLFKFTTGTATGEPNLIKMEKAAVMPLGQATTAKIERDFYNSQALKNYYQRNFGGQENIDDFMANLVGKQTAVKTNQKASAEAAGAMRESLPTQSSAEAGESIYTAIDRAKGPVKNAMNALEDAIPEYPMKFTNLRTQIDLIKRDPTLPLPARRAIESFEANDLPKLLENGETTKAWRGINSTLGAYAAEARESAEKGGKTVAAIYERLRHDGLKPDLDVISDLAVSGKIMTYKGHVVSLDDISRKLEVDLKYLAEMKAVSKPDIEKMLSEITAAGERPVMQVVRESDASFAERLGRQYKMATKNQEIPVIGTDPEKIAQINDRVIAMKQILAEASPGQDVGVAIRAFNEYAREQYFKRFGTTTIEDITRAGGHFTGKRLAIEDVPKKFKTFTGATELKQAVGDARAKELMRGNLAYDLLRQGSDDAEKLTAAGYHRWLKANTETLKSYGLYDEFKTVANAQALADSAKASATEFEKSLAGRLIGSDPKAVISQIVSGNRTRENALEIMKQLNGDKRALRGLQNAYAEWVDDTAATTWKELLQNKPSASQAQFSKAMKKGNEVAQVIYRTESAKFEALKTMQRAHEISFRITRSPTTTGTDTAEKTAVLANQIALGALDLVATGGTATAVRTGGKVMALIKHMGQKKFDHVLTNALFDPDYAYSLVRAVRGKIDPAQFEAEIGGKIVNLEAYRQSKIRQTVTGTAAAASGSGGNE